MRHALSLLAIALLASFPLYSQEKPAPVKVCVATLENSSRYVVSPTWERDELVRALERSNKSKEVKKGKAAKIETVALESSGEADSTIRDKNCQFVVYTNLTEVFQTDRPSISVPPPGAIQMGTAMGDPRAYPQDYNSATVNYRLMRAGNPRPWTSGMVTAQDRLSEDILVSQLMDQIANRVVKDIREPHASEPE